MTNRKELCIVLAKVEKLFNLLPHIILRQHFLGFQIYGGHNREDPKSGTDLFGFIFGEALHLAAGIELTFLLGFALPVLAEIDVSGYFAACLFVFSNGTGCLYNVNQTVIESYCMLRLFKFFQVTVNRFGISVIRRIDASHEIHAGQNKFLDIPWTAIPCISNHVAYRASMFACYPPDIIGGRHINNVSENDLVVQRQSCAFLNERNHPEGVCKKNNKWEAYIYYSSKKYYLGVYNSVEEAAEIRKIAKNLVKQHIDIVIHHSASHIKTPYVGTYDGVLAPLVEAMERNSA